MPPLAGKQVAEGQPPHRNSFELMNLVPELGQHAPNLTVLSLVEDHLEDSAELVLTPDAEPLRMHFAFCQPHALPKPLKQFRGRDTGHLHKVLLLDAITRMGEQVREVAVIGEKNEPFAHAIEPSDRKQSTVVWHEVNDSWSAGRVEVSCHHADRLVKEIDHATRIGEPLTIDANLLGPRIDLCAKRGYHLAIHLHSAGRDKLLAGTPASKTGSGEHFLKPLEAIIGWPLAGPLRGAPWSARSVGTWLSAWGRTGTRLVWGWHKREARGGMDPAAILHARWPSAPLMQQNKRPDATDGHCAGAHKRARFTSGMGSA